MFIRIQQQMSFAFYAIRCEICCCNVIVVNLLSQLHVLLMTLILYLLARFAFFLSLSFSLECFCSEKKHWSIVFNKHCSPAQLYGVCSQIVQRSQTNTHSIYIRSDIHMSIYIRLVRSVIKFFSFLEQPQGCA